MKLLHTADWQIGKQFGQIAGDAGVLLRTQRLDTVKKVAETAAEKKVDAVLVAGDVFDDNAVSDETLRRAINAMSPFNGPWALLPGNHDAALAQSAWTRLKTLGAVPSNVVLCTDPEPLRLCDGRLCILPAPLQRRHEARDLSDYFDRVPRDPGVFRVGLAHGAVTNRLPAQADGMNPIADTRETTARLDYLALGDWHGTLQIAPRTWYAGTPEPDRFKANDPGNVLVVTLNEPGSSPEVEKLEIGHFRWIQDAISISDGGGIDLLEHRLSRLVAPERTLLRLQLEGTLDLAQRLRLSESLAKWRARLHFLSADDGALIAQPSAEDLASMQATGFVCKAIDELIAIQADQAHPDHSYAAGALQMLFGEQLQLQR